MILKLLALNPCFWKGKRCLHLVAATTITSTSSSSTNALGALRGDEVAQRQVVDDIFNLLDLLIVSKSKLGSKKQLLNIPGT